MNQSVQECEGGYLIGLGVDQQRHFAEIEVCLAGDMRQTWIAFNEAGQPISFSVNRLDLYSSLTTANNRSCLGEIESVNEIEGGFLFEGSFGCFSIAAATFEQVGSKARAMT